MGDAILSSLADQRTREAYVSDNPKAHRRAQLAHEKAAMLAEEGGNTKGAARHKRMAKKHATAAGGASNSSSDSTSRGTDSAADSASPTAGGRELGKAVARDKHDSDSTNPLNQWLRQKASER
jgi:hypothetical protein